MFVLKDITLEFGGRRLLDSVGWMVKPGDRVALIGGNGVGKSTLMKIIAGHLEPDAGEVNVPKGSTFGYLPQDGITYGGQSLIDEVRSVFSELLDMDEQLRELEEKLSQIEEADEEYETLLSRYGALQEHFRHQDGFRMDVEVGRVLEGLGFSKEDWQKPCEHFSGGWQMRIALAKLLLRQPSLLLLDEPTNHLDLEARNWMKDYLNDYPSAVVLVSHDRHFLDVVVRRCTELFAGKLTDYYGNFTNYEIKREQRFTVLRETKRRQDEEIAKIERFIERFRYKATKATQVQSRIKQLAKIERIEIPPSPPEVSFSFPEPPRSGRIVLELKGIHKAYGDNKVLRGIDWKLERGERVALLGINGAGKSTLMRIMADQDSFEGERVLGHLADIGFFAQDQRSVLDPKHNVLQSIESVAHVDVFPKLRTLLGSFLFRGDDVYKKVSVLSGGERSRLAMARMLLQPYNVLLLDEPTNHLDIHAQKVLLQALKKFSGTIVFVSHDRHFIEELATSVVEVDAGKAHHFLGSYEEYRHTKERMGEAVGDQDGVRWTTVHQDNRTHSAPTTSSPAHSKQSTKKQEGSDEREERRQSYSEKQAVQREFTRRRRQLEKKIETGEQTLEEQETRLAALEELMSAPSFYDNYEQATQSTQEYQTLKKQVEEGYVAWEVLQEELQTLLAEQKVEV